MAKNKYNVVIFCAAKEISARVQMKWIAAQAKEYVEYNKYLLNIAFHAYERASYLMTLNVCMIDT